jgi:hypothetical protein
VVKNKCLAAGTRVFDPISGKTHRVEEVVDNQLPIHVVAADKKGELHVRPVVSWFDQGEQEVIGLRVKGGAEIWVTPDHKILSDRGWVQAADLGIGCQVALATRSATAETKAEAGTNARGVAVLVRPEVSLGQVRFDAIKEVLPRRTARTFDVEVEELHNLVAEDIVVHNCAPPFKQAEFDIMYGKGISREGGLIDVGVEAGLVRKAGAWYTYEGDQLGQGKENARTFLRDNPDLANEIEKKILEKLGIGASVEEEAVKDPEGVDF